MSAAPFEFARTARTLKAAFAVIGVWLLLLGAWIGLEAATWLVLVFAAFTLPAIFDFWRNPAAGLILQDGTLRWYSGRREAQVTLDELDHMRLDTRLDFSVRATAVLQTGQRIRLPFEATPPHQNFEQALLAHGVKVMRHHFQLMQ